MNDISVDELLRDVIAIAPELETALCCGTGNARFNLVYNLAINSVSKTAFGDSYKLALSYFIAHILTLQSVVSVQGATSPTVTQGSVQSEKEGDLQISYGSSSSVSSGDELLNKTFYGRLFLLLRRQSIFPAMTRLG